MENAGRTQIASGPYRIAGTVVNAKGGNPLPRCRVTLTDTKNAQSLQSLITGDDGRFEFHVRAGKYSLGGAKRGFIASRYDQHERFSTAIVTGADVDTENLVLRLTPNAVLTGKVLDEFGDGVRNAQIGVYREDRSQGVSRIYRLRGAATDDQGRYEVAQLDEGTYFVSAKASPWYAVHPASNAGAPPSQVDSSLDAAYPITFYGDATEAQDATPIPLRGGDRLEADIHLNPVPALHLILPAGQNGEGVRPPILQKAVFDGFEPVATNMSGAQGVLELNGVAPGQYTVRMPDSSGKFRGPTEVNLSGSGELDVSAGAATSTIKARVQLAGAATLPSQLQIALIDSKGRRTASAVDAKAEADFSDVVPGKYEVTAGSPTQRYAVVHMASEAGAIPGHSLNVTPGASLTIALSLVGGSVTVEGFAKRSGKPVSGVMLVLAPNNPSDNRDRFRRDQSDLDGSFSFGDVIPGSYTILAIENGWDLDWAEPAALSGYLKHGQALEIGDRSPATVHLESAVEVQAR
jgi:hypothetical protein